MAGSLPGGAYTVVSQLLSLRPSLVGEADATDRVIQRNAKSSMVHATGKHGRHSGVLWSGVRVGFLEEGTCELGVVFNCPAKLC